MADTARRLWRRLVLHLIMWPWLPVFGALLLSLELEANAFQAIRDTAPWYMGPAYLTGAMLKVAGFRAFVRKWSAWVYHTRVEMGAEPAR